MKEKEQDIFNLEKKPEVTLPTSQKENRDESVSITPAERHTLISMVNWEKGGDNFSEKEVKIQESVKALHKKLSEKEATNLSITHDEKAILIDMLIFKMDGSGFPDYKKKFKDPIESLYEKLTGKKYFDFKRE